MKSFMRHIATKVLFLVLVSWVLAALQPCCEVIAATLPHEHSHSHEVHHASNEHTTPHASTVEEHEHCGIADNEIDITSALVGEKLRLSTSKPKPDTDAVVGIFSAGYSVSHKRSFAILYHPPPPESYSQAYLLTQRLRI